ncbi:MAG: SDR family NAD(P)-dependent oxidoreductase [Candidatus Izemoplasmatales bacterium]|nr:SDR family NAD(P)-dependent oxidoreductase [Candidatus Izemoplasmatales bacterium]MDD3865204.1 SDR family NAD(P)-dependent oxidoreductase [Candidatus Izemoplasmatales bacterium]
MKNQTDKLVIVTGSTSGIGFAIVLKLLESGYSVIGVGSKAESCQNAKIKITAQNPTAPVVFYNANLANQQEIYALAHNIKEYLTLNPNLKLHCLINNAGGVRDWYMTTSEGYEYQFALNHLSGFLLTYLMVPLLKDGIVIFTASSSHKHTRIHWQDIMFQKWYFVLSAYKQSKLCNVMTVKELNKRGIKAFAVDPGLVKTDIGNKGMTGITRWFWNIHKKSGTDPEVPAQTYVYLCNRPKSLGLYYYNSKIASYNKEVDKDSETMRLFALSEKLCGISYKERISS